MLDIGAKLAYFAPRCPTFIGVVRPVQRVLLAATWLNGDAALGSVYRGLVCVF